MMSLEATMSGTGKEVFVVDGLYRTPGAAHAVRHGNLLYTAGVVARDAQGAMLHPGDMAAQARRVYADLGRILAAAGASFADVVKVNYYVAPEGCTPEGRSALRQVHREMLPAGRCAGLGVSLPLADAGLLIQVELIVAFDSDREAFAGLADTGAAPGFAAAVRAGDRLYGGTQVPPLPSELAGSAAQEALLRVPGGLGDQTYAAYAQHDRAIRAAGFGWDQVVQVHQFLTPTRLSIDEFQAARTRFLTLGKFLSTSVACPSGHPDWPLQDWLLTVDLEADRRPARAVFARDVWGNPGGPQAFVTGNLMRMHGQVGRNLQRETQHENDAGAQAALAYSNIASVLREAGSDWDRVLHVRSFCKGRENLPAVIAARRRCLPEGRYVATDLLADYFDPKLIVEIEVVAIAD